MQKEAFVPASMTVAAGTHVIWTNTDTVPHSVTAADNRFDSGPVLPGKSFEWTAGGDGAVNYHCIFHPSMTATLTVGTTVGKQSR
jgi:plastocyanin